MQSAIPSSSKISLGRRSLLGYGFAAAMGGLGLPELLRLRNEAGAAEGATGKRKPANCILIWMDGGPTHFETFDPKPDAPVEIRGEFETIQTKLPGVHFSKHMTKLAASLDKFALLRSVCHNQGNHGAGNHYMMTGAPPRIPVGCGAFVSFHPSMGSVASYERPAPHGLPPYFSMPTMSRSGGPNFLGAKHAPFVVSDNPNGKGFRVWDVALPSAVNDARFAERRRLRGLVDQLPRIEDPAAADPVKAIDQYYGQGYELVTTPEAQKAFDIDSEPEALRERYVRNDFGQRLLLSRRLVEAGVPFVTVYDGGWDHHSDLFGACNKRLPSWDQSVATLIEDLSDRGMLDDTIVVALGEFGRTPKLSVLPGSTTAGRDHWSNAMSILMAGAGIRGGQVIGATDRNGYAAVERVLSPENFVSTIYSKMGIDPGKIYYTPAGRPAHLVSDPTPIAELM